jgi:hypothetical protein
MSVDFATFVFSVNQQASWRYRVVNQYDLSPPSYIVGSASLVASGSQHTISLTDVGEGLNTLNIELTDDTGNVYVTTSDWKVDLHGPTALVIDTKLINGTLSTTASFKLKADDNYDVVNFYWSLDGASYVQVAAANFRATVSLTGLGVGAHNFSAYAEDNSGNVGYAEYFFWEVVEGFDKTCCEYLKTCLEQEYQCYMSDITKCERTAAAKRSDKCKECLRCNRYSKKLVYNRVVKKIQSDAIEKCIPSVDPKERPISPYYYPSNTLIFSVCKEVSITCSKYKDFRGYCPESNPRNFQKKYGVEMKNIFKSEQEVRTHRHILERVLGPLWDPMRHLRRRLQQAV